MKITLDPAARVEFAEAARWYAVEAGRLQAMDFRNEGHRTLALLQDHPLMGSPSAHDTRHMVVHRYPYFVDYRADGHALRVLAIAHQSRRPGYWTDRRLAGGKRINSPVGQESASALACGKPCRCSGPGGRRLPASRPRTRRIASCIGGPSGKYRDASTAPGSGKNRIGVDATSAGASQADGQAC
ncbi:MAG: type II toxin-antitoxin system RelE/ParE family toxin [Thiobacillus sp.]|nr:type II toxin-antitoxin system RelE/ParE family toxin [Thiobacillus sp.]